MAIFTGTPGADFFDGRNGANNTFVFDVTYLQSSDIVLGNDPAHGSATDLLRFTKTDATPFTVTADAMRAVAFIDSIELPNIGGTTIQLDAGFAGSNGDLSSILRVAGGAGDDGVDASATGY